MKASEKKHPAGTITRNEALQSRPVRNRDVREAYLESGEVVLSYPRQIRPWVAGLMKWTGKMPGKNRITPKKLQLDILGTAVWSLIDGKRSVRRMIDEFARQYQLHPKEAEVAVTRFLHDLGKRGVIGLK
ncbi:MAG: PqqD family protein [Desulfobacterales bacterium]|nr:PqqD family protein [Desulfobacterales bacterium]